MLVVRTSKRQADSLGQLVGAQKPVGFDHLALAINPLGLHRIEPRALLGQQTTDDPYPSYDLALFQSPVVRSDPPSDLAAYVPCASLRCPRSTPTPSCPWPPASGNTTAK